MTAARPAVYDCNVLLGAILSSRGANYACVELVMSGCVTLILSSKVLLQAQSDDDGVTRPRSDDRKAGFRKQASQRFDV